jgi:hypothetical protein
MSAKNEATLEKHHEFVEIYLVGVTIPTASVHMIFRSRATPSTVATNWTKSGVLPPKAF